MSKCANQKTKLLYLYKILSENTDEAHQMSMSEIIDKLATYNIEAERKSLYTDMEVLQQFGINVVRKKHRNFGYYIADRVFELAELKLLVDSVQCSKFITPQKSKMLVKKLETLTSRHNAKELARQLYNVDKPKSSNETIYSSVDTLHHAIGSCRKIAFKYSEYNTDKEKCLRNGGNYYVASPYSLLWSNENYYLIAHYPKNEGLTHFRVDRIVDVRILNDKAESIKSVTPKNFSLSRYSKNLFSMYSGDVKQIVLKCCKSAINPVIDKLGMDVSITKLDDEYVSVSTKVSVSPPFFAWIFQFGNKISIIEPEDVKEKFIHMAKKIVEGA